MFEIAVKLINIWTYCHIIQEARVKTQWITTHIATGLENG